MSAPIIDVRGALAAAGIRYRTSGNWTRIRAEWRGSKDYNIAVSETGGWHDHATGDHGRWAELCERLGLTGERRFTPLQVKGYQVESESDKMRRARIFHERSAPVVDRNRYLQSRGPGIIENAMQAGVRHRLARKSRYAPDLPCIIWPIFDLSTGSKGQIIGVQREWDRGHDAKRMFGKHILNKQAGGFIIPATGEDSTLYVVEGPVTGCAVAAATGCAVLVLFDTAGLQAVPPAFGERYKAIVIAADNDKSGAGEKAAQAAARRILLRHPNCKVQITRPPDVGTDWADINEQLGPEAVRLALAAGLRAPEPPTPKGGNKVVPLVPWEKTQAGETDPDIPIIKAEAAVERAVRRALEVDTPTVVAAITGLGKTAAAARAAQTSSMARAAQTSSQQLLILSRTLDDTRAVGDQIPGSFFQKGRDADNCYKFSDVDALQTRRRTPYAHLCAHCEHGCADSENPCKYMTQLRESVYHRVVVAAHGAGAEASLLYEYAPDIEQPNRTIQRKLVVDECPPINTTTKIEMADIVEWRAGSVWANEKAFDDTSCEDEDDRRNIARGREWAAAMTTQLDILAEKLGAAPAIGQHLLILPDFAKLATRIPRAARLVDGTLFERVRREGGRFVIPLKAIELLGQAMAAGTCWTEGGHIIAVTPGALWTRIIQNGGVLLDATPSSRVREEVLAVDGEVHTIRAAQPHLHVIQYGPRLHGRGGLTSGGLAREGAAVRGLLDADSRAVCITHHPVAAAIDDARCGHWGRDDRAHNRWREAPRLILRGLPLLSPAEQRRQYAADRAALAAVGVEWAEWDGAAVGGQTVEINGWKVRSAARLPTEPQARAWLLDRVAGDVAQAIGRLRAVRRAELVTVEIYGMLPLVGHGIRIDEFRHEREGRAADGLRMRAAVAAGVLHLGEHLTRARLSDFVLLHRGVRASNTTLDSMLDEIKSDALTLGTTLEAAVMELITKAEDLLSTHDGDAVKALDAVAGHAPALELLLWACAHEPLSGSVAAQGP